MLSFSLVLFEKIARHFLRQLQTYPMLPVSLDCPFFIASSVFSNVYPLITTACVEQIDHRMHNIRLDAPDIRLRVHLAGIYPILVSISILNTTNANLQ